MVGITPLIFQKIEKIVISESINKSYKFEISKHGHRIGSYFIGKDIAESKNPQYNVSLEENVLVDLSRGKLTLKEVMDGKKLKFGGDENDLLLLQPLFNVIKLTEITTDMILNEISAIFKVGKYKLLAHPFTFLIMNNTEFVESFFMGQFNSGTNTLIKIHSSTEWQYARNSFEMDERIFVDIAKHKLTLKDAYNDNKIIPRDDKAKAEELFELQSLFDILNFINRS